MGSDVFEVTEALPSLNDIKVHRLMCAELIKLINSVSKILPETEEARPGCSTGIGALCSLNKAIGKAKLLLQHCSESSKLYLALTGDTILTRCQKSTNLLEQSLSQLQNMVPVMLAAEISKIISDLRVVAFSLDPSEEEAGKVLWELLHQYRSPTDSTEETAFKAIQGATVRLHINSQKDLLIETRSIRKLLDKIGQNELPKRKILLFLQHLLKKYGKLIVKEQKETKLMQHEESIPLSSSSGQSVEVESRLLDRPDEAQSNTRSTPGIPEEFKCPLSLRLMYDPVVIASGLTFERMWIQRWFDEGHDVCPKTQKKLSQLSLTSNTVRKDLISKWCAKAGVTIPDPSMPAVYQPLETSSTSIASLSSSVNDLALPIDFSNSSIRATYAGQGSVTSHARIANGVRFQCIGSAHEIDLEILYEMDSLPWEYRCKVVKDIQSFWKHEDRSCSSISCENLIPPLLKFLKDADDAHDVEALRSGCLLLSAFVKKCRSSTIPCLEEDTYALLASFLDTEVAEETIGVLEVLSCHQPCDYEIAASGALHHILRILDKQISGLQEPALKILCNLSAKSRIRSFIVPADFIPKLVPYFDDSALAGYSVAILKNLCDSEDARAFLAETDGCIASLTKLLESDSQEDQEYTVGVLLSLCSQRIQYCDLVMEEGVIPGLVAISVNGNNKGKAMSVELLRLLHDGVSESEDCHDVIRDTSPHSKERKSSSKVQEFFGKMSKFSKHGKKK
nr:U-box domain-containing protein 5 isoform X1 [Coffea arabica]XP_027074440.1 U-box domain-containing protein 5 isoform X1 [Coffea arabica]